MDLAHKSFDLDVRVLLLDLGLESEGLRLVNVFSPEQKLSVQVADVDSVKVNDLDLGEACHGQTFDKFTTDSSCSNYQDVRGLDLDRGI